MPPKGKRRASQRVSVGKNASKPFDTARNTTPGPSSPKTNKKRRVEVNSPIGHPLQPSHRSLAASPDVSSGDRTFKIHGNVRTPPVSRRQQQAITDCEKIQDVGKSPGVDVPVTGLRTAETIPEGSESDDCDVHVVQRQNLDKNKFYRRYFRHNISDDRPRIVARKMFSPLTPHQTGETFEQVDNDTESYFGEGNALQDRAQVRDSSPVRTTHPVVQDDLEEFHISRDILKTFYKDIEHKITSDITALRSFISSKFHGIDALEGKLMSHVNEVQALQSVGRTAPSPQNRLTPLAKYESKLDSVTPHGDWVFNSETLCKILRVNLSIFISTTASEHGEIMSNISLAIRAILFCLLPSQKRAVFSTGVRKKHSAFRFTVVMNVLYNVQHNSLQRFLPSDPSEAIVVPNWSNSNQSRTENFNSTGEMSKKQIKQPNWLKKAFIRRKHVEEARARLVLNTISAEGRETTGVQENQKKVWISVKDIPDNDDVARYGALKVYRSVTTGLYQAREKSRWVLFEELLYFMVSWEDEEGDIDQRTLQVKWGDEEISRTEADLFQIPDCKVRSTGIAQADESNANILAEFLSSHREMVIYVGHEVRIKVGNCSSRQRRMMENRILQRTINLIDVATKFCVIFSEQAVGGFSHLTFLGAHRDSLKCIYAIALMLRGMVEDFMEKYIVDDAFIPPSDSENIKTESYGLHIEHLIPAASVRKRLLMLRCLRMNIKEYEKLDMTCVEPIVNSDQSNGTTVADVDIGADDDGVMLL